MRSNRRSVWPPLLTLLSGLFARPAAAADPWVVYEGKEGPGKGKYIVLISGDEEYRSEEALPQLAKILAVRHGFKCTVLFAIDPKTGTINPNVTDNIPGLESLKTADLMVIFTRFRNLPDGQMKYVADYIDAGKPVDEQAVTLVGGNPSGTGVRLDDVPLLFEHRHIVADRGG